MNSNIYQLTKKQYDELVSRKKYLEEEALPNNSQEIERAKEFGDLSENAEYHAAKELQSKLLTELNQITSKLNRSEIIKQNSSNDRIEIGHSIEIYFENKDEHLTFNLIGENGNGITEIDINSRLGSHLYGKSVGDWISYEQNDGVEELRFRVVSIK